MVSDIREKLSPAVHCWTGAAEDSQHCKLSLSSVPALYTVSLGGLKVPLTKGLPGTQ